ncbi:MAG TPA: hypothetical protein VK150_01715 [Geothrix sp.]|nr:hypothetical protein [Geothrix sp.]
MKLTCPSCGAVIDFDQAARGTEGEALAKAAALFGADWELASEYVDAFRQRRDAALALKKRLRLLREVWEIWRSGQFDYDGQVYQVGKDEIRAALAQVANRELQGLKNHNYLKQILKASAREFGKQQEEARREREHRLQAGRRDVGADPSVCPPAEVDPEIPRLVSQSLFGKTEAARQAAKDRLAALGVKK